MIDGLEIFHRLERGEEVEVPLSRFDGVDPLKRALLVSHVRRELYDRGYDFSLDPVRNKFIIKRLE